MAQTFYEVLGVPVDASQQVIRDAYREKVKEHHPDVSEDPSAGDTFKAVVQAEEVLGDPEERETYDRLGHRAYVRRIAGQNVSGHETSPWTTKDRRDTTHDTGGVDPRATAGSGAGDSAAGTTTQTGATAGSKATASEGFGPGADRQHATGGGTTSTSHGFGTAADRQHGTGGVGRSGAGRWDQRSYSAGGAKESADSGYSVRDWADEDVGPDTVTITLTQQLLVIAVAMFVLYPILVWSSVTGMFPLLVNVIFGAITLLAVGYLLTVPRVAVAVFGGWSVIAPVGILAVTHWNPLVSLFALGVCWIPFGYAVTVSYVVRPE